MPGAIIAIDQVQSGPTYGSPGVARNDIWQSTLVTVRCTTSGNTSFEWELLDVPPGSATTLSGASSINATFNPDLPGSYRVQLTTNGGGPGNVQILIIGVRYDHTGMLLNRGWCIPALGEVPPEDNFSGNPRGWDAALRFIFADILAFIVAGGGGGSSVTGSGFWHSTAGVLDAAASHGAAGQIPVGGTDIDWVAPNGDLTLSSATPGDFTVVGVRGQAVAPGTAPGQVWQYTGSAWAVTSISGALAGAVSGTGLWTSTAGALNGAASIGTDAQFLVTAAGPSLAWVSMNGDATLADTGAVTVTHVHGQPVAAGVLPGQLWQFDGANWDLINDVGPSSFAHGTAGQVLTTSVTPATVWATAPAVSVTTAYGAVGNNSTDDTAAWQSAVTGLAGSSTLWSDGLTYKLTGFVTIPAETHISFAPGTTIHTTQTNPFTGVFQTYASYSSISGAYNSDPGVGAVSVSVNLTGAPSAGQILFSEQGNTFQFNEIKTVTPGGGGNYTLVLTKPVLFPFDHTIATLTIANALPHDITLDANGGLISGPGDRGWESTSSIRMRVNNLRIDTSLGSLTDTGASFDGGGYGSQYRGLWVDGSGGTIQWAIAVETQVYAKIFGSVGANCGSGINILDSFASGASDSDVYGNSFAGFRIGSNGGGLGNNAAYVRDGSSVGNTNYGAIVESGSVNTRFEGLYFQGNNQSLVVQAGAKGTWATGITTDGGVSWQINAADEITIVGWTGTTSYAGEFFGALTKISNATLHVAGGLPESMAFEGTSAFVRGLAIDTATASVSLIKVGTGYLTLSDSVLSGGSATGISVSSGASLYIGLGVDMSGMGTPLSLAGGSLATMVQPGPVASVAGAAGTTTLTFAQHYCRTIEVGNGSPISAGAQVIDPLASFIGQEFIVKNYNTTGSTTTVFGVVIPPLNTYRLRCNAAGTWEQVNDSGAVTWAADLAGSNSLDQWVAAISGGGGSGGTVALNAVTLQWSSASTTAGLSQASEASALKGADMVFTPQQSTHATDQGGGNLVVALQAPAGAGVEAALVVTRGGAPSAQIGPFIGAGSSVSALWLGLAGNVATSINWSLANSNLGTTYLNTPGTQIAYRIANADTAYQTAAAFTPAIDLGLVVGGPANRWTLAYIQTGISAGTSASGAGVTFAITAEAAQVGSNAAGGVLSLSGGALDGSATQAGYVEVISPSFATPIAAWGVNPNSTTTPPTANWQTTFVNGTIDAGSSPQRNKVIEGLFNQTTNDANAHTYNKLNIDAHSCVLVESTIVGRVKTAGTVLSTVDAIYTAKAIFTCYSQASGPPTASAVVYEWQDNGIGSLSVTAVFTAVANPGPSGGTGGNITVNWQKATESVTEAVMVITVDTRFTYI